MNVAKRYFISMPYISISLIYNVLLGKIWIAIGEKSLMRSPSQKRTMNMSAGSQILWILGIKKLDIKKEYIRILQR
ncbi:TVG0788047 [Thermoplasma volcanium GSS1]|uniref:TVG0788047 protein n=1 Tax=Thermoplasma volcanium (strain ATCC 51530 / DSM 4299 / JCM 9571 / NBRC 15438 / GSS1) TaxID=273116 RepID=Q97AM5_THEVO|nr:TVG0788047 [Thermoplasma volcanium GSS1]